MGGFFDRLGSVATGLGGAVLAPFGFAKDLAVGAFTDDDEFDSFLGTIWGAAKKWGGSGVENLIGPEEGLGAAIGALPGSVRRGVRTVTDPVFAGLEAAGREVVREPLTALMSAASLMDAGHGFDLKKGYEIAQTRSLGQAVALAFLTDDIEDEVEVAKAVGTDWYDAISGTTDALARLMLEPDILVGKFYRGARKASVTGAALERTVKLPGGREATIGAGLFERAGAATAARVGWVPGARAIRTNKDINAALVSPELVTVNEHIATIKREAGVGEIPVGSGARAAEAVQAEASQWDSLIERLDSDDGPVGSEMVTLPDGTTAPANEALETAYQRSRDLKPELEDARLNEAVGPERETMLARRMQIPNLPETRDFDIPNRNLPDEAARHLEDYLSEDRARRFPAIGNFGRWAESSPEYQAGVQGVLVDLPDELVVFRGDAGAGTSGEFTNVTLKHGTAERFATEGWGGSGGGTGQAGRVTAYKVNKADVIAIGAAPHRELILRTEALVPVSGGTEAASKAAIKAEEAAKSRAIAKLRDLAFHDHKHGETIATVLIHAPDPHVAWGALMGRRQDMDTLASTNPDLAGRIDREFGAQAKIDHMNRTGVELPEEVVALDLALKRREIEAIYPGTGAPPAPVTPRATTDAELRQIATGPKESAPNDLLFSGYTEDIAEGPPGISREGRPLTADELVEASEMGPEATGAARIENFVSRGADGKPNGVVSVVLDAEGQPLFFHTAVHSGSRRQGIATKLVKQAEEAGFDLESVSGRGGLTPEGAEFALARRAKAVPPPPASIDDVVTSQLLHAERLEAAGGMVRELPHISGASQLRRNITRSNFYQRDWRAAPLRLATNMRPRPMVNLEDAGADIQVARVLRKANAPLEIQDQLRGEMAAAMDAAERQAIMARTEAAAIKAVAEKHGMTAAEAEVFINIAARNNKLATSRIQASRKYDGQGRAYIENRDDKGTVHQIYLPISKTQTFNHYLLADMDAVDRVLAEAKTKATRMNTTATAVLAGTGELMEKFNQIWKPSVLLRVGWPIRVVGEEQLRIMSQIGALLTAGRTMMAGSRYGVDTIADVMKKANQSLRRVPKDARVARDPRLRGLKLGYMNVDGWNVQRAMGTVEDPQLIIQQMNSAKGGVDHLSGVADTELRALQKEVTGEWASLDPVKDIDSWSPAWEGAVNDQIRGDAMWRQFIDGKTVDEVAAWIRTTKEGKAYLRTVPHWKKDIEGWLEAAAQVVDDYLPTPELRQLATQRALKADDIIAAIPDAGSRPVVHGAVIRDIQGKTAFMGAVSKMRDTAMRVLGTLPTDVLSRQPYFDWHYTNEMRRLINIATEQGVEFSPDLAARFSKQSRTYALGESKKLLYDLADDSELAHTLRFISPFFNASQEVITRWTGIAVDNPAFVLRMQEVWRAPEKAGIVQDENGNTISADGTYATSALGERVEKGKDRFLNMRLLAQDNVLGKALFNDLTRALPGVKLVERAKFNKDGLNTIMQMPGVGPMVQIPLNEIAKSRPQLEDSLKWALPFGATQDTLGAIMPATAKRFMTLSAGEEDRQYANTVTRFYMDELVNFNLEKRATKPTYEEAQKKADEFWKMRTIASFVSPVAPSFQSPYQFHIDKYRALMERDPETAMDKFLADEGEDFFPLTQSLTKTMNGVPPTDEGDAAYQKYQDMIQKHPDLGGLIIGEEGAGEFSNSVYQKQLATPLKPGSGEKQRAALSFEEVTKGTDVKLAWREYSRTMDLIEAARIQRGLPNLQVKGARDLADIKRNFINQHGDKYPDWLAELNVVDRGAWNRKLTGLKEIAADERLANRDEIQVLRKYLDARNMMVKTLQARDAAGGSATINASSNMDLAGVWSQITSRMVEQSLPFSDLFYRYLERDPLTPEEA